MRKIYIIGTIHGFIPKKDVIEILEKYNPEQVMIEVTASDLKNKKFKNYGKEFKDAYEWCKKNRKKVIGFDYWQKNWKDSRHLNKNEKKELDVIIKDASKFVKRHGWKNFNKKKYRRLFNIVDKRLYKILPDQYDYLKIRQKKMLANIKKRMIRQGVFIILTGTGHLDFFQKHLKAEFPFRKAVGTH